MLLTKLLVLLQIDLLFESVELLVKFSSDLDLSSKKVELVLLIHLDLLIEVIDSITQLLDQRSISSGNHIIKEYAAVIFITFLDCRE